MVIRLRLLTLAEVAEHTHIPPRTLQRWVAEGRLTRYGGPRQIKLAPLEVAELAQLRQDTPSRSRLRRSPVMAHDAGRSPDPTPDAAASSADVPPGERPEDDIRESEQSVDVEAVIARVRARRARRR